MARSKRKEADTSFDHGANEAAATTAQAEAQQAEAAHTNGHENHAPGTNGNGHAEQPRERVKIPDPFARVTLAMDEKKDGAKARVLLDRENGEIQIQFDVNPGREITEVIKKEGGFHWESQAQYGAHKGAWAQKMREGNGWRLEQDAKRYLRDAVNTFRAKNGLEPVTVMGVMDR